MFYQEIISPYTGMHTVVGKETLQARSYRNKFTPTRSCHIPWNPVKIIKHLSCKFQHCEVLLSGTRLEKLHLVSKSFGFSRCSDEEKPWRFFVQYWAVRKTMTRFDAKQYASVSPYLFWPMKIWATNLC